MGIANRRMSYHRSASRPNSNTRTNQEQNHADGSQTEDDKAAQNDENEALKDKPETDGNDMVDDPHDEHSCEEEAEPVENEDGSKAVSSVENRKCSMFIKIVYSKANTKLTLRSTMKERKDLNVWSVKDCSVPSFLLNITLERFILIAAK